MPLHVGDFVGDTQHLSATETGAYIRLIIFQWRTGSLPTDDARLCRIAGIHPPHWKRLRAVLAPLFGDPRPGGQWVQKRAALEYIKNEQKRNEIKARGQAGAIAAGIARARATPSSNIHNKNLINGVQVEAARESAPESQAADQPPDQFWHALDSPEFAAWKEHRSRHGKGTPIDQRGGWYFPTQWPPSEPADGAEPVPL